MLRKWLRLKKCGISISLLIGEFGINLTSCGCHCEKDIFFDKQKLIRLAQFYPKDFSSSNLMILSDQLDNYIFYVRSSIEFSKLEGICDFAQKMVETKKMWSIH